MSNVSGKDKREQVIALGRLGWSLRRIEAAVHIRRETIGGYLRAAGIPVRSPGGWGRRAPAKPANEVITDSGGESATITVPEPQPSRNRSASICEQYRELIDLGLSHGRNAKAIWQDLVDSHGFTVGYQSVQRFVGKLRRAAEPPRSHPDAPCARHTGNKVCSRPISTIPRSILYSAPARGCLA